MSETTTPTNMMSLPPGSRPVIVRVAIVILSVASPDIGSNSIEMDMSIAATWFDNRTVVGNSEGVSSTSYDQSNSLFQQVWTPAIELENAVHARESSVRYGRNMVVQVYGDGRVKFATRLRSTLACHLKMYMYPFDTQLCRPPDAEPETRLRLEWIAGTGALLKPGLQLAEFTLDRTMPMQRCDEWLYPDVVVNDTLTDMTDRYSCITTGVALSRRAGGHLIHTYASTATLVLVAGASFWIDCKAVPARVALTITTLLTISTTGNQLRSHLPQVEYETAIDYWFMICWMFIFSALMEFCMINNITRNAAKRHKEGTLSPPEREALAESIDTIARVTYPVAFTLFVIVYFVIISHKIHNMDDMFANSVTNQQ